MYAAYGSKFVGKRFNSYVSWKRSVTLCFHYLLFLIVITDWRRPPYPVQTADYATYVQVLTWFLDTPVPEAPFSVHRMALAGKELGTDVGQWFRPSVAAGAIRYVFFFLSSFSGDVSLIGFCLELLLVLLQIVAWPCL